MLIAVTGATGFLGRYIVRELATNGHNCRCWCRRESNREGLNDLSDQIEWIEGELTDPTSMRNLTADVDAVVHAALDRPGMGFRGAEGDLPTFVERNVLGTIKLIEASRVAKVGRFIFIATCSVHEIILEDRKLDETHPLWPTSHYGAHKAAIEKFIHSYGLGGGYPICSLRPTGIYGLAHPTSKSKWYDLVHCVARGEPVSSARGGKEVHAGDVAKAVQLLLTVEGIAGQAYNCYDRYIAEQDVAEMAKEISGSSSRIEPRKKKPKHQIDTSKIRSLGMTFGGEALLRETVRELLEA